MKTKLFLSIALVLFPIRVITYGSSLPEAPIEVRLARLAGTLRQFTDRGPKNPIVTGILMKGGRSFTLKWTFPAAEAKAPAGEQSSAQIVDIVVKALHEKMPDGLRPETEKLLGVSKYFVTSSTAPSFWLWVTEFRIEDESPVAGAGFEPTLVVPIAVDGTVLLEVSEKRR